MASLAATVDNRHKDGSDRRAGLPIGRPHSLGRTWSSGRLASAQQREACGQAMRRQPIAWMLR